MLHPETNKSIVQIICRDFSGCSNVRLRFNQYYLTSIHEKLGIHFVNTPIPCTDTNWLSLTKAFICQRFVNEQDYQMIKMLKEHQPKFGYKLIYELDDIIWMHNNENVPDYNMASFNFAKTAPAIQATLQKILPLFDQIVASTDYLAKAFREDFNLPNVTVIKNVVPSFLWGSDTKAPLTSDLVKPHIGYTGAPQHYRNPIPLGVSPEYPLGVTAMTGDWTNEWVNFIKDNVKNDKIDFTIHSTIPYFFEDIADKIRHAPWVDTVNYPQLVKKNNYDIIIAPLQDNMFNKCKSDLRFIEGCIAGSVVMATDFKDGPYEYVHPLCKCKPDITQEELNKKLQMICQKDVYNSILKYQYDYLEKSGRRLESNKHINEWLSMID